MSLYPPALWTRCQGTWLEQAPDEAEQRRIDEACHALREQRRLAIAFYDDPPAARAYSLELFTRSDFAPLHLNAELIQKVLAHVGEPPVVQEDDSPEFAGYMRQAALTIATSKTRRHLSDQLRRLLPQYVEAEAWKSAIAIDNNAFRTALGNEVTPFLVQMTFGGLLAWYEEQGDE